MPRTKRPKTLAVAVTEQEYALAHTQWHADARHDSMSEFLRSILVPSLKRRASLQGNGKAGPAQHPGKAKGSCT